MVGPDAELGGETARAGRGCCQHSTPPPPPTTTPRGGDGTGTTAPDPGLSPGEPPACHLSRPSPSCALCCQTPGHGWGNRGFRAVYRPHLAGCSSKALRSEGVSHPAESPPTPTPPPQPHPDSLLTDRAETTKVGPTGGSWEHSGQVPQPHSTNRTDGTRRAEGDRDFPRSPGTREQHQRVGP